MGSNVPLFEREIDNSSDNPPQQQLFRSTSERTKSIQQYDQQYFNSASHKVIPQTGVLFLQQSYDLPREYKAMHSKHKSYSVQNSPSLSRKISEGGHGQKKVEEMDRIHYYKTDEGEGQEEEECKGGQTLGCNGKSRKISQLDYDFNNEKREKKTKTMSLNSSVIKEKDYVHLQNQYSKSSIDLRISARTKDMETQNQKQSLIFLEFTHQDNLSQETNPAPFLLSLPNNQFTTEKQEDDDILDQEDRNPHSIPQNVIENSNQNEPIIPDGEPINDQQNVIEEEMNNNISTTKTSLIWRISALNMLLSLLRQKLTLKRIWLLFHYFPLALAFLIIAIHQTIAFCTLSIAVHFYIYAILSLRNFLFNIILLKRISRHITVLEFYVQKPLAHISFRNSLNDLQHNYKSLEIFKEQRKLKELMARQSEGNNRLEGRNQDAQNQELIPQQNRDFGNLIQPNLLQAGVNVEQQEYLVGRKENDDKQDNPNNIDGIRIQFELEDHMQQSNHQIQEILDLPLAIIYSSEDIQQRLMKAPRIMDFQRQYESWRNQSLHSKSLSPKDLLQTDFLIDTYQQLQKIPDENAVSSELENIIKYGENTFIVRLLRLYAFFEETYMLIYCIMQVAIDFCSLQVGKAAIFFGFYYSAVKILQLTVIALTLAFFALSLVFYVLFKVISLMRRKASLKTISFKKAKLILLKNSKITELEKDSIACIICYEVFKDQDAVYLSSCCQKCYHKACIQEWFTKSKNCPLCRTAIT